MEKDMLFFCGGTNPLNLGNSRFSLLKYLGSDLQTLSNCKYWGEGGELKFKVQACLLITKLEKISLSPVGLDFGGNWAMW